jgi:hypothetical protein
MARAAREGQQPLPFGTKIDHAPCIVRERKDALIK